MEHHREEQGHCRALHTGEVEVTGRRRGKGWLEHKELSRDIAEHHTQVWGSR